jgi:beta-galactosidase/beta-glucuronidase
VPMVSLGRPRITPDVAGGAFHVDIPLDRRGHAPTGRRADLRLKVTVGDGGEAVCAAETSAAVDFSPHLHLVIPPDKRKLWEPGKPHLYDLDIQLIDAGGKVVDEAMSYAGLRSVAIHGKAIKINGNTVFQRLVLDQGFYPSGIMTAPTDEALVADIELSMKAGFNGARLHQKVFEERFLFHADRLGYLCWGEFADWSLTKADDQRRHHRGGTATYLTQWLEALARDYSHPCIVGWCGLNETREPVTDRITDLDDTIRGMFLAAKAMDPTRPVLDCSGYVHRMQENDVWDCHNYKADPAELKKDMDLILEGKVWTNDAPRHVVPTVSIAYRGQPFFNSEFGGILWNPDAQEGDESWGYGESPKTIEQFYDRFERQCAVQLENPHLFGYCYTQLTDVFQEQNGIYRFDRRAKFDMERIRAAQVRPAAIEDADAGSAKANEGEAIVLTMPTEGEMKLAADKRN